MRRWRWMGVWRVVIRDSSSSLWSLIIVVVDTNCRINISISHTNRHLIISWRLVFLNIHSFENKENKKICLMAGIKQIPFFLKRGYSTSNVCPDYAKLIANLKRVKSSTNSQPLTLAEKVLYSHQTSIVDGSDVIRNQTYLKLTPDRVAMQDASAQTCMLQFMLAGRARTAGTLDGCQSNNPSD